MEGPVSSADLPPSSLGSPFAVNGKNREPVQLLQCQFKNMLLLKYSAEAQ